MSKNDSAAKINEDVKLNDALASMITGAALINKDAIDEEIKETETESPKVESKESVLSLDEILQKGKKGITNRQMIPAIKKAIDENNTDILLLLKNSFPLVFGSSIKYIGHQRQNKLKEII